MSDKISNIIKKIIKYDVIKYERLKYEDYDGYYNVWKVTIDNNQYILKQVSDNELSFYKEIECRYIPYYYGSCSYYKKTYMLLEYINGNNLMKCEKENLKKALDAIINIQSNNYNINSNYDEKLQKVINRKQYLNNDVLEKTYEKFIIRYQNIYKTLTHDDLLPFNVLVKDDKAVLIDWEHFGILPYPLMICRLLAHCMNNKYYTFYMKDKDKDFAINYYYINYVSLLGIDINTYLEDINYFMFYEYTEWIYVYNKYNKTRDNRYEYYMEKALEYACKLKQ